MTVNVEQKIVDGSVEHEKNRMDPLEEYATHSICKIAIPVHDTTDSFLTPPAPTLDIRKEFVDEVPLRARNVEPKQFQASSGIRGGHLIICSSDLSGSVQTTLTSMHT